jgi:hypothetical protein
MRKQASKSPEVTGGLGGSQPRSPIGVSGRPGASPERGWTVPSQGTWPCRAGIISHPRRPRPICSRGPRQRPPGTNVEEADGALVKLLWLAIATNGVFDTGVVAQESREVGLSRGILLWQWAIACPNNHY